MLIHDWRIQVDQQQQSLAELEQMLANLSVSEQQSEEQSGDPDVFTLQQYQGEVAAGRLKPYQVPFEPCRVSMLFHIVVYSQQELNGLCCPAG